MKGLSSAGTGRARALGGALLFTSRLLFSVLFVAISLSTVWEGNPLVSISLFRVQVGGEARSVPALLLVPVVSVLLAVGGMVLRQESLGLRARWGLLIPAFGFGLLTIIRSYPVHRALTGMIAVADVSIFWAVLLYTWWVWPPRWVWSTFAILLAVQGGVGVLQFIRQGPVGLADWAFIHELAPLPTAGGASVIEASGRRWLRAYGLTPHPNVLGGYLSIMLWVVSGAWLESPRSRRWLLIPVGVGLAGLFTSFSRAAWLGGVVGLLYFVWLVRASGAQLELTDAQRRRSIAFAGAGGLLILIAGFAFRDLLVTRFLRLGSHLEAASIRERVRDAGQAWMLFRNLPLRGVGTGYYVEALWAWAHATGRDFPAFQHVHNIPLLAAAEMGVGGAVLWLWLLLAPPLDALLRTRSGAVPLLRAGLGAAFVVALIVSMTDYFLYLPTTLWPSLYLGALCGLAVRPTLREEFEL